MSPHSPGVDGIPHFNSLDDNGEYPGLYQRFAELVQSRTSEVDIAPVRLVADAFIRGDRRIVEAFDD